MPLCKNLTLLIASYLYCNGCFSHSAAVLSVVAIAMNYAGVSFIFFSCFLQAEPVSGWKSIYYWECRKDSYETWGLILTLMLNYCLNPSKWLHLHAPDFPICKKNNRAGSGIDVEKENKVSLSYGDAIKPDAWESLLRKFSEKRVLFLSGVNADMLADCRKVRTVYRRWRSLLLNVVVIS